jgi:predicted Zn-dependent protease
MSSAGLPAPPPAMSMTQQEPTKSKKERPSNPDKESKKESKEAKASRNAKNEKDGLKSEQPIAAAAGDYFEVVRRFAGDKVARWKNFPVRLHLPADSPASWQRSLDSSIKRWDEYLPVKVVPASQPADVEVVWVNKLVPQYLGITRLVLHPDKMQVHIFLLRPTYYLPEIPERVLANVFLHELGHGLGIFGHSDSKRDLMYASELEPASKGKNAEIRYAALGESDVNTLRHIYATDPVPEGFGISQPMEWGCSL